MTPIQFNEANKNIELPNGETLHFFQDGITGKLILKWQLTPEELAQVAETGTIYTSQIPGATAEPLTEISWRETTEKEAEIINTLHKVRQTVANQMNRKPMAGKRVKLKSVGK